MNLVQTQPRSIGSLPPVGPLSFGLWRYTNPDVATAQALLETALDAGHEPRRQRRRVRIRLGWHRIRRRRGESSDSVLAVAPHLRDRMVLATKGGIMPPIPYDSSPSYLRSACEASLRRMGVDVIDLYQIHRPDLLAHPADVAATLATLRDEGKIREVGVSNHTPAQVAALAAHLPFPIASNQPEFSALHLDPMRDGTFDACMGSATVALAWSPLAGGRLATGDDVRPELLEVLDSLAAREGVDRATIAIAFVLAHPAAPVAIVGSQNPERIAGSTAALGVELTRTDVYAIIQASEGVPLP